jgi:hypothetical protein
MANLVIPSFPDRYPARAPAVAVRCTMDIDVSTLESLKAVLAGDLPIHSAFRQKASFAGGHAELSGLIGIHPDTRKDQSELFSGETPSGWIHFEVSLTTVPRPRTTPSEDWQRIMEALGQVVDSYVVSVFAYWHLPAKDTTLGVTLPIPLESSQIPGFKEIRGVRLVQPEEQGKDGELYSLIIDRVVEKTVVQVRSTMESALDDGIIVRALEHSLSIANLAVEYGAGDA